MKVKKERSTFFRPYILLTLMFFLISCAHKTSEPPISFDELSTNLNTPKLISDYQVKHFKWASEKQGGGCGGVDIGISLEKCSPSFIHENKGKGNCGAFTTFSVHSLRKAGYEAYPLYVHEEWPSWLAPGHQPRDYHIMTLYRVNDQWFTIDNGTANQRGIKGPYNRLEDLPYKVLKIDKDY